MPLNDEKIAICFHLGYIDRFQEFTPHIDQVIQTAQKLNYSVDLYISYREETDPSSMCLAKYPNAIITKATHGCDIGAFLIQIQYMLQNHKKYRYVYKLHTKSRNAVFPNWNHELVDETAGSVSTIKKVFKTFKRHHKNGMIACRRWILKKDIDCQIFHDICFRNHIDTNGYFVGGTIFWVKFSILKKFFSQINIQYEYSLCELGKPCEPSYTHSWERILGLMVSTYGYQITSI